MAISNEQTRLRGWVGFLEILEAGDGPLSHDVKGKVCRLSKYE